MKKTNKVLEIWKDIPQYEGYYQVSSLGNIKSLNYNKTGKEKIMTPNLNKFGYLRIGLSYLKKRKNITIHQIVAIAFLNHTPCGHKLVVNHKDFNRLNNCVENLEIITQRENANQKHFKSTSKYVGVCWAKNANKWRAVIWQNKKQIHLGLFTSELDANEAYIVAYNRLKTIFDYELNKLKIKK